MAQIAAEVYVLKDALLKVDADNYEKHVSSVTFTPNTSQLNWQSITPSGAFSDSTSPTWTCAISYAQDWKTANSLSQYLLANSGESKTVVFYPLGDGIGMPTFTATLKIVPGPIGGDVNTVQVGTVTMGVVGAPELGTVV